MTNSSSNHQPAGGWKLLERILLSIFPYHVVSSNGGTHGYGWSISWKIHPEKMDDWGVPPFWGNLHVRTIIIPGWWLSHPSEKYNFVNRDDEIPKTWKNRIDVPKFQTTLNQIIIVVVPWNQPSIVNRATPMTMEIPNIPYYYLILFHIINHY